MRLDDGAVVGREVVSVVGVGGGLGPAAAEQVFEVDRGGEASLEVMDDGLSEGR